MIFKIILWVNISLLLLHEMDAVRTMEWKMMIFVNKIENNLASCLFISAHLPLLILVFYMYEYHHDILYWITCIFPIFHHILHLFFRDHPENRMNNFFSKSIIILMTLVSTAGIMAIVICNY